jgi:CheY-like chemotaxis protein
MSTKVLVFESDPAFAGELRNELGKLGCSTTVVDDGNVGLQQAASDKPDLILLSIELPRMNGFSVCNKLKKDAGLKEVPLVIMSSESSDETFEQHKKLRTRAEDYVHKPIAFGELLQHIQRLVTLGGPAVQDLDAAIVIDDEIEIGSTDYMADDGTQIGARPPISGPQRGLEAVDADVEAFADAAFGRLTGSEPPGAVAEARPIHNGTPEGLAAPAIPKRVSSPPSARPSARPSSVRPSVRPPTGVDIAEYEKIREELVRTRARAGALETELGDARNELEKLRLEATEADRLLHEVDELKAKLASAAPKGAAISSRDFLDLREALNKKDKEILALKEQSSRKDKEIVEVQDRMLALERSKGDLDDRSLALERELAETKERNDSLAADKDLAKKVSEDFKARFEKARAEAEAKDRLASDLRARHAEELANAESKLVALRADFDQTLANERAEQERLLDDLAAQHRVEMEQAKRDREAALASAREQAERARQEALADQAAQLKQESDAKILALLRSHQQELDKLRAAAAQEARDIAAKHEGDLAAARAQGEEQVARARAEADDHLAQTRAELEKHENDALAALGEESAERVKALENDRDARIAVIEARAARELSEANDKLAKADMDLSATRGELGSLREAKAAGEAAHSEAMTAAQMRFAEMTIARDDLATKLTASTGRATALEADLGTTQHDLAEARQRLAGESARAERAHAKWDADRQSLERAKDALAVALAQIEEAEERPIG